MPTITVDENGTQLAYLDSGIPATSTHTYVTIFAVHGTIYDYHIYDKVFPIARSSGVRFVSISRRGYPDSTAFTADDLKEMQESTDVQKEAFMRARGSEIATFIDAFSQTHSLPLVSNDGRTGGIALVGWSLGAAIVLTTIAHVDTYPAPIRARITSQLRALIIEDAPQVAIGTPIAPKSWVPPMDKSITPEQGARLCITWLTAYFRHGDLSKRSLDEIEYVVPATFRAPSIYTIPPEILRGADQNVVDAAWYTNYGSLFHANYKACFDRGFRAKFPWMKVTALVGETSLSFGIAAAWQIEDDDKENGGGLVNVKWIPGANHFLHWDEPALALKTFVDAIEA